MVSQGSTTFYKMYSIKPTSLYLLIKRVLNHLPSQLAPEIQLMLHIKSTDQVSPWVILIGLCQLQEVRRTPVGPIICIPIPLN